MDGGSFGAGMGAGIGVGIAIGMGAGMGSGKAGADKKRKKQLQRAIEANAVAVHDENGNPLTSEALFELLDEKYKKG